MDVFVRDRVAGTTERVACRTRAPTGPTKRINTGLTGSACTFTNSGLIPGKTYYYRVTSVDAGGLESLPSNQASAKPARWRSDADAGELPPGMARRNEQTGNAMTA